MTPECAVVKRSLPVLFRLLLLCCLSTVSACAYFNTYYNAKKYFAQAEKARERQDREVLLQGMGEPPPLDPQTRLLYQKAAERASRVLEKYRESRLIDDAMFLMGKAFYWQKDYQGAARSFEELEENFPQSKFFDRARYWRGMSYERLWMEDQARTLYRELFSAARGDIAAQAGWRLAELAFARGDYAIAVQECETTLQAIPDSRMRAALWLRLGEAIVALMDSSRHDQALEAFNQVMRAKPSLALEYQARLNTGQLYYSRGDVDLALRTYMLLLSESRFRIYEGQTRILVGQHYQYRGQPEKALAEFTQVRNDFPQTASSAMAIYQIGLLYLREYRDMIRASHSFQEARREKTGSEAALLAQELLGYLNRLEQYTGDIRRADSLAVVHGSTRKPDSGQLENGETLVLSLEHDDELWTADDGQYKSELPAVRKGEGEAEIIEKLLEVAELYRDPQRVALPDSAIHYYLEIIRRFPDHESLPRLLYNIAWAYEEMLDDREAAKPYLKRLLEEFPATAHANAARRRLGLEVQPTIEEQAASAFSQIEDLRLQQINALEVYVPLLDSLGVRYPRTQTAAKAAYLAAFSFENLAGDSLEAERRYQQVREEYPGSPYAGLVAARDSVRREGALLKLERRLKLVGGEPKPGEQIAILALEPDSLDSSALARKYAGFGLRAQRRGAWKQARHFYELSLEARPEQPRVLYRLANTLREEGYLEDARRHYREALATNPGMLEVQYRLLYEHLADGQIDSANHYLRLVVRQDGSNPQVEALRQRYPGLLDPNNPERLESSKLSTLELEAPEDELEMSWSDELLELPVVREVVRPVFPAGSDDSTAVILDLLIGKDGATEAVEVFIGEDKARAPAVAAARNYRFFPAIGKDGEAQRVWVELIMPIEPPSLEISAEPDIERQPIQDIGNARRDSTSKIEQ